VTKRVMLVEVTEMPLPGAFVVEHGPVSCATCRWAEDYKGNLRCDLVRDVRSKAFIATNDDAELMVAPDFGCTQWEGK
jgi:hypothetical protein